MGAQGPRCRWLCSGEGWEQGGHIQPTQPLELGCCNISFVPSRKQADVQKKLWKQCRVRGLWGSSSSLHKSCTSRACSPCTFATVKIEALEQFGHWRTWVRKSELCWAPVPTVSPAVSWLRTDPLLSAFPSYLQRLILSYLLSHRLTLEDLAFAH